MSEIRRAIVTGHVRAYGEESNRIVTFRASTPIIDRHKTIVIPSGIDTTNYEKNPIFLWAHDGYDSFAGPPKIDSVLGRAIKLEKTDDYFDITDEFAGPAVNPVAEKALRMVRGGFLNAVSIGFYPKEARYETIDGEEILVFHESELLEHSLVPIPANPDALQISNALDRYLGLTPPPDGAEIGEQLRQYAAGLRTLRTVREFTRSIARR